MASGDPSPDGVVLWTRVSVTGGAPVPVRWTVATDPSLSSAVVEGAATASPTADHTVHVIVSGLRPATHYWYGFAAGDDPNVAVCLLPGTELAFESDVEYDPALGSFLPNRKVGEKVARFRKVNNDQPHVHHDALEFPSGQIVLLTRLCEGQRARVLQLPASPHAEMETEAEAREERSPALLET